MTGPSKVFLFGASGHASVIADIIERENRCVLVFLADDDASRLGQSVLGYAVIGGRAELLSRRREVDAALVAIGANAARRAVAAWLASEGFSFARALHPSAQVGRTAKIGAGSVLMACAVVNPGAEVGEHCIVNTCASVDHDCWLGDGVHVAPGARLCGGVEVGAGAFVCAGAVVAPKRRIGANAIIAAGSVVLTDIPEGAIVAGNPAKPVRDQDSIP